MNNREKVKPRNKQKLMEIIYKECEEKGWECDLNFIDTSLITDMSYLFSLNCGLSQFNGDISQWDMSNVIDMSFMFSISKFNGDISQWNVTKVENMSYLFFNSKFNGDISQWNVSNVIDMYAIFLLSNFEGNINEWKVYSLEINDIFLDKHKEKPYWYKNYKENKEKRKKQIDKYHLNKK